MCKHSGWNGVAGAIWERRDSTYLSACYIMSIDLLKWGTASWAAKHPTLEQIQKISRNGPRATEAQKRPYSTMNVLGTHLGLSLWSICYCFPFGVSCSCHVSVRLTQVVQSDKTQTHRPNFSWLSHQLCQWSKLRTRTLENKNTRKKNLSTDMKLKWYMQFFVRPNFRRCNSCTSTEMSSLSSVSVLDRRRPDCVWF